MVKALKVKNYILGKISNSFATILRMKLSENNLSARRGMKWRTVYGAGDRSKRTKLLFRLETLVGVFYKTIPTEVDINHMNIVKK